MSLYRCDLISCSADVSVRVVFPEPLRTWIQVQGLKHEAISAPVGGSMVPVGQMNRKASHSALFAATCHHRYALPKYTAGLLCNQPAEKLPHSDER